MPGFIIKVIRRAIYKRIVIARRLENISLCIDFRRRRSNLHYKF